MGYDGSTKPKLREVTMEAPVAEHDVNLHEYVDLLRHVSSWYYNRDLPEEGLEAESLALDIDTRLTVIHQKFSRGDELIAESGHVGAAILYE